MIRNESENVIEAFTLAGWQLFLRYWLLSVFFLYKYVSNLPSIMLMEVSKNVIESSGSQLHISSIASFFGGV